MPDAANRKIPRHGLIWNIAAIAGLAWAGILAFAAMFFQMAASMPESNFSFFLVLIVLPIPILIVSIALAVFGIIKGDRFKEKRQ